MKETITRSLYYQILFLKEEEVRDKNIMLTFQSSQDITDFIDATLYTLENTSFFQINNSRLKSLVRILKNVLGTPIPLFLIKKEDVEKMEKIIDFCKMQISENEKKNIKTIDEKDIFNSMQELKKRNLLYCGWVLPNYEEVIQSIITEYPIIESLVNRHELPKEKFRLKELLSAISLLITTYKEILLEDKELYYFILHYLNSQVTLPKNLGQRKRIQVIVNDYLALEFPDKEEKLTLTN